MTIDDQPMFPPQSQQATIFTKIAPYLLYIGILVAMCTVFVAIYAAQNVSHFRIVSAYEQSIQAKEQLITVLQQNESTTDGLNKSLHNDLAAATLLNENLQMKQSSLEYTIGQRNDYLKACLKTVDHLRARR
jgi:hypothetical protein